MSHDGSPPEDQWPRVGVSACLLGERVRYDGGHRLATVLVRTLGGRVCWVPVCPEARAGMGTPREPIRLERDGGGDDCLRVIAPQSGTDWTMRLRECARSRLDELAAAGLHGFVLKARSPSCGLHDAPVHAADGVVVDPGGRGLFAAALARRFPGLPLVDEDALSKPAACEAFLARVLAYARV